MISFDEFVKKYEGKTVGYPNNNSFLGECLSLSKWHIKEVYGIEPPPSGVNAAYGYWTNFPNPLGTVLKKVSLTGGLIPKRGWIVVWNNKVGNGYGHIASVLSATASNFVSLDANWGSKSAQRVTHNYNNVYGFLAPKGEPEGNNMSDLQACLDSHAKLMKEIEQKDKIISEITADKDRYKSERDQARSERDNYAEENKGLSTQIELLKKDIAALNNDLEECQNQATETPSVEEYTKGFAPTGRTISQVQGDLTISTTYKVKE